MDVSDVLNGLSILGVSKTHSDVDVWVKRASKGLNYLTFDQFKDALLPHTR